MSTIRGGQVKCDEVYPKSTYILLSLTLLKILAHIGTLRSNLRRTTKKCAICAGLI